VSDTGGFDDWRRPRGARPDDSADDTAEGAVNDATGAQAPEPAAPPVAPPPSFSAQPPLSAAPPPVFQPAAPPPPVTPSLSTTPPPPVTPALSTAPPPAFPPAAPTPAFPVAPPAGPALNTAPPPADPPRSQAAPPPVVPPAPDQAPPPAFLPAATPAFPLAPPAPNLAPPPLVAPTAPAAAPAPPVGNPLSTTPPPAAPTTASLTPTPAPSWEQPTQAYSFEDLRAPEPAAPAPSWEQPTQAYDFRQASLDPALAGPTEVLGAQEIGLPTLRDEGLRPPTGENSAIDSLFGENQFQEYEAGALPAEGFSALASTRPRLEREPLSKTQRTLLLVAGGLVAALALIGVFAIGVANPGILPAAEPEPVQTSAPAPVAAAPAVGPLAPGTYAWDELLGTECLDPWTSPWAEEFTVVDCTAPHPAQLVSRGIFGDEAYAAYPGVEALQARMNLLCTAPTSIDYGVASALNDVQVSSAYPVTEEQWDAGQRSYFCYVTRSGSETLTVSLAPVPVVDAAPVPSIPGNAP